MEDKSIIKNTDTVDVNATYINDCIKEVCLKGDSLTKYKRMIEKKYGAEFYQKCGNFIKEVKRLETRNKITNTSIVNLKYLASQILVDDILVDSIVRILNKKIEEKEVDVKTPSPKKTLNKKKSVFQVNKFYSDMNGGYSIWPKEKDSTPADLIIPEQIDEDKISHVDGFEGCNGIQSIVFKSRRELRIHKGAFRNCKNLRSVHFESIMWLKIDSGAFEGCDSLNSLSFSKDGSGNLPSVDINAFTGCPLPLKTRMSLMRYRVSNFFE